MTTDHEGKEGNCGFSDSGSEPVTLGEAKPSRRASEGGDLARDSSKGGRERVLARTTKETRGRRSRWKDGFVFTNP